MAVVVLVVVAYKTPKSRENILARLKSEHAIVRFRATVSELNAAFPNVPLPGDRPFLLPPSLREAWSRGIQGTGWRLVYTIGPNRLVLWTVVSATG